MAATRFAIVLLAALALAVITLSLSRAPPSNLGFGHIRTAPSTGSFAVRTPVISKLARNSRQLSARATYATVQGTTREQNEDRLRVAVNPGASDGDIEAFYGVYDGHGGDSTSEWLQQNFYEQYIKKYWSSTDPKSSVIRAYEEADIEILQPRGGVFGIGAQRGIGGARCGSTAATAIVYKKDGKKFLMSANIGDSMVLKKGKDGLSYMTTEHVPDNEEERKRIEMYNPNPKMPLVRFVEKTWRVGGLLALSRAFGDAYLKPSLEDEGIGYQDSDYMSGFGLIARPDVSIDALEPTDQWMVIASDGLFETENRGGGGGLVPEQIEEVVTSMKGQAPGEISAKLASAAQAAGSTDDVTVIFVPLQ